MNETEAVIFFLQTLHYRDDLEAELFKNLQKYDGKILSEDNLQNLYTQRVHSSLIKNTQLVLSSFGVISQKSEVNKERLEYFMKLVEVAKAARKYNWPSDRPKPFIYVSPPTLITSDLSGDVDDISNLLINLVRSATKSISIMSPFTNKEGLKSILSPLKACKNTPKISLFLTANEMDKEMIYKQVREQIPGEMLRHCEIYFCSSDLVESDNLPHAKVLIIDSSKGYLGSANFTKQGLKSRFELGVELDDQQSKTVDRLLSILVTKGTFTIYNETNGSKVS